MDDPSGVLGEHVTNSRKKGKYWMNTLYRSDYEDLTMERCINILKELDYVDIIIAQAEVGEHSGEEHIHIALVLNSSDHQPVPAFTKAFGRVYISNSRRDIYRSYCSKRETMIPKSRVEWIKDSSTAKVMSNIKPKRIVVTQGVEEKSNSIQVNEYKELVKYVSSLGEQLETLARDNLALTNKLEVVERDNVSLNNKLKTVERSNAALSARLDNSERDRKAIQATLTKDLYDLSERFEELLEKSGIVLEESSE